MRSCLGNLRLSAIAICTAVSIPSLVFPFNSCLGQSVGHASSHISADGCPAAGNDSIVIPVEITDKSGRPISGIEASDFKLFDNNEPRTLLDFHAVDAAHPPAVPIQVLFVIDAINSNFEMVAQERDGLSAFLKQSPSTLANPTTITILRNSGLKQVGHTTQDPKELLAAVTAAQSEFRVLGSAAGLYGIAERRRQAVQLIENLAAAEAKGPGRKIVLFLGPGWPLLSAAARDIDIQQRSLVFDDIVELSNGLRQSCISLYTLDPSEFGDDNYENFLKGVLKADQAQIPNLGLQVLSVHSGGQVIIEGNDIEAEINTALRDATVYYSLSFESPPAGQATEYHAIRVTIDKPHLKVRTVAGYYVKAVP